ncbi:MAG: hypothetical protein ACLP50_09520 [Solirubrobacteraceae bacterium]
MPTVVITIEIPDGASISINAAADDSRSPVETYWSDYLSDNGRELYAAAGEVQLTKGPDFTLHDLADQMGREYASAQSIHRTTGRTEKRWKQDMGSDAPIQLIATDYTWDEEHQGNRTTYRLPDGVADEIAAL